MKTAPSKLLKMCRIVVQLSALAIAPMFSVKHFLTNYNPDANKNYRAPANFAQDEEFIEVPSLENEIWLSNVLVDDKTKSISGIRNKFANWEALDNIAQDWSLEEYHQFATPDDVYRKAYLEREMLKYFDKRLAGEISTAEDGSAMAKVGVVHKALRPNTKMVISDDIRLRFKAYVLQGTGNIIVENPYVEAQANFTLSGQMDLEVKKDLKNVGFQAVVKYYVNTGRYIASINQKLTETISAQMSSDQEQDEVAFAGNGDKVAKVIYTKGF